MAGAHLAAEVTPQLLGFNHGRYNKKSGLHGKYLSRCRKRVFGKWKRQGLFMKDKHDAELKIEHGPIDLTISDSSTLPLDVPLNH